MSKEEKKALRKKGHRGPGRPRKHHGGDGDSEEGASFFGQFEIAPETAHGIVVILFFLIGLLSLLSLLGLAGSHGSTIEGWIGYLFGWARFLFPALMIGIGVALFYPHRFPLRIPQSLGILLLLLSLTGLFQIFIPLDQAASALAVGDGGGVLGQVLAHPLRKGLGTLAALLVLLGVFLISVLLTLNISIHQLFWQWSPEGRVWGWLRERWQSGSSEENEEGEEEDEGQPLERKSFQAGPLEDAREQGALFNEGRGPNEAGAALLIKRRKRRERVEIPLDLFDSSVSRPRSGDIEANKQKIQTTLNNFGIEVEMGEIAVGPTVTQYTFRPSEGVKLSQITTLQNDLALALAAHPIRIEAPIPGKALVGVEIPNKSVAIVRLRDVLGSKVFRRHDSNLTIAIGKDVAGDPVVADLESMPHLLIAGATGSGKSVMINALIISLLMQNGPDDLKLILIDPKRVELTLYNGIPHLLTPVIIDAKKTINALRWSVAEMDRRYELLSNAGKKNILTYNQSAKNPLPYLVIVIDELADLMAVAAKDVEAVIIRLAQMARAVGIHLVVATQRPSVDVITGLIKANITARMAFNVASLVDSRTILDHSGAEKLLGRGDMLFIAAELSKPRRLQGAFVDESEVTRVANYLKEKGGDPEYDQAILEKRGGVGSMGRPDEDEEVSDDDEELASAAREVIVQAGKASASLLQRRLRIGYARAARLLDILEDRGMIGPAEGAKPREVYIDQNGEISQSLSGESLNDAGAVNADQAEEDWEEEGVEQRKP